MKKMGGGLGGVCIFFTGLGHFEFIPQVYVHLTPIRAPTELNRSSGVGGIWVNSWMTSAHQ